MISTINLHFCFKSNRWDHCKYGKLAFFTTELEKLECQLRSTSQQMVSVSLNSKWLMGIIDTFSLGDLVSLFNAPPGFI